MSKTYLKSDHFNGGGSRACNYMTSRGKQRELRHHWQRAAKLIAKADVLTVSRAPELALFMDAKLDVSKIPAKRNGDSASLAFSFGKIGHRH